MNRVKFAGLILSTGVHPGAEAMLTRNGVEVSGLPAIVAAQRQSTSASCL
jgi:hypothetical protein